MKLYTFSPLVEYQIAGQKKSSARRLSQACSMVLIIGHQPNLTPFNRSDPFLRSSQMYSIEVTLSTHAVSSMGDSKLFQPIKVGNLTLSHRIVLAPMTWYRSTEQSHIPYVSIMKEYYTQRASDPGTLLITEATFVAQKAGIYKNAPGAWTQAQLSPWKEVRFTQSFR